MDAEPVSEPPLLAAAREAFVSRPVAPAADLVAAPMRVVTRELRPSRRLALASGFATDLAVASAVRLVLDGDPAIVARRCRVEEGDGTGWLVQLTVAASYAHYQRHGDAVIRNRVATAVRDLFGVDVAAVDIEIVDVFTGAPGREPTR